MEHVLALLTISGTLSITYICLKTIRERNWLIRENDILIEENGILIEEIGNLQARLENARHRTVHL